MLCKVDVKRGSLRLNASLSSRTPSCLFFRIAWLALVTLVAALASKSVVIQFVRCFCVGNRAAKLPTRVSVRALPTSEAAKLDGSPDELFYLLPRIGVYHVDDNFRNQLTQLYRLLIPAGGDVVDLCSQHDSHLPPEVEYRSLTVHGMNYLELLANTRATDRFVQNFNRDPSFEKLRDNSVDAVTMAVSIQYMQNPVEVLEEIRRVLRPGGVTILSFSNRMFFTKATEAWRSQGSMRGLAKLVTGYFTEAGLVGVRAVNGVTLQDQDDSKAGGFLGILPDWADKNPFVAVLGFKDVEHDAIQNLTGVSWLPGSGPGTIW